MVEFSGDNEHWQIVLRPNQAFTWRQNRVFLFLIGTIYLAFSLVGLWFGLWPILFFSGLDIALLFIALWWVVRKNQQQIVLRNERGQLVLEAGRLAPEFTTRFPLAWATVIGRAETRGEGWASIRVGKSGQHVEISHFLNQQDRQKLWQLLTSLGVKTRREQ